MSPAPGHQYVLSINAPTQEASSQLDRDTTNRRPCVSSRCGHSGAYTCDPQGQREPQPEPAPLAPYGLLAPLLRGPSCPRGRFPGPSLAAPSPTESPAVRRPGAPSSFLAERCHLLQEALPELIHQARLYAPWGCHKDGRASPELLWPEQRDRQQAHGHSAKHPAST